MEADEQLAIPPEGRLVRAPPNEPHGVAVAAHKGCITNHLGRWLIIRRIGLEGARRAFSRRFQALAESAEDFPYPPEPPTVEPGPKLG